MENQEPKEEVENINEQENSENAAEEQQNEKDTAVTTEEPDAEVAKIRGELEASKDKYIRLYSEFENFRRRTAKEKLELIQSANEQLIKSILPVIDDFDRASQAFQDKMTPEVEGFFLIHSKLKKVLEVYSVKVMDTAQGTEFNADLHEAISQIPAPSAELKGKIVDCVEKGYLLNDKVIRYAKVVVGN